MLFFDSVQVSVSYPLVFYPSMVARSAQSKNVSGRKRESNEHGDAANQFLYPLKGSFRASRHIAMRRPEKKVNDLESCLSRCLAATKTS